MARGPGDRALSVRPAGTAAGTPAGAIAGSLGGAPAPAPRLPTPPAEPAGSERARRGPGWALVVTALAIALLGLVVAVGALVASDRRADDLQAAREDALAAARERTVALTSYDHRSLDADVAEVLETAVDPFRSEYEDTTADLRAAFTANQAVAEARVVAAGLESGDADRAVVVVAVDQVITTAGAQPRTERNRLRMTLVRPDGTWLVERVERL